MKNLANCKPSEFLAQTNKIRKVAADWLDATGVLRIRKASPDIPEGATKEERERLMEGQIKKNLSAMLDAILEENPEKTLELLALLCFVEPKDVDKHTVAEYIGAISELISNPDIIRFFVSLVQLGKTNTLTA